MEWILWVIVGLLVFGSVSTIVSVGKPKEPTTPVVAAVSTVLTGLIVWAIIGIGIYG